MLSTGIVRRIDDLGRVVIPKEIRARLGIKAGDPLELYLDQATGFLCMKKYVVGAEALAPLCAKYVAVAQKDISAVLYHDDCITVIASNDKGATVKRHQNDSCDFNIAIAYALAKLGYTAGNPVVEFGNT